MPGTISLRVTLLLAITVAAAACSERQTTYEFSGRSMGTTYSVQLVRPPGDRPDASLGSEIVATLDRIENRMSTYLDASEVSRFNEYRSSRSFPVSIETCRLTERAIAWSEASGGAFDITVAPLVNAWGFGPEPSPADLPDSQTIAQLILSVGFEYLEADCSVPALRKLVPTLQIDLSGFAKGYAVDEVALLLDRQGYPDFLVEIGGELKAKGRNAAGQYWRIAIENPVSAAAGPAGIVQLRDTAMATSGDYRNSFEFGGKRYSHTIDPRTGWPVDHQLTAVTVIGESAADADALATALLVLGPGEGDDLAEELRLSVRFLLREDDGYRVRDSAAFRSHLDPH